MFAGKFNNIAQVAISFRTLLGATRSGDIAFGEFDFRPATEQSGARFTASFSLVRPFDVDEIDEDYVDNFLSEFDAGELYEMCVDYDCPPSELAYNYLSDHDVSEMVDCDIYPEDIEVDGATYMFESITEGQIDLVKEGMADYVDEQSFETLHDLWKKYHMKKLTTEQAEEIYFKLRTARDTLTSFDEEEWIADYLC